MYSPLFCASLRIYIHEISFHPQYKPRRDGADLCRRSAATPAASRRHGGAAVRAGDARWKEPGHGGKDAWEQLWSIFGMVRGTATISVSPACKPRFGNGLTRTLSRCGKPVVAVRRPAALGAFAAYAAAAPSAAPDVSEQAGREFDGSRRLGADRQIPFIRLAGRREVAW
jgi:hypothetical protein